MIHNSGSKYYCGPDLGIQHTFMEFPLTQGTRTVAIPS